MVSYPGVDNPPFRLSMLIYDRRYRSLTVQVVVFIAVMLAASWLINNVLMNLSVLGKTLSFDFLFRRAGYDIPQQLIPYNSDDTHLRATVVGLLNTLLVSVLGCVSATVLGVIVGVLRLSSNWLIARLMTIYVEVFRNIPLLLWILVVLAIFTDTGLDFMAAFKMDLYNNLTMTMIDGQNPFAEGETQLQMTYSYD